MEDRLEGARTLQDASSCNQTPRDKAPILVSLGEAHLRRGKPNASEVVLQDALQVSRQARNEMGEASALRGLGRIRFHLSQLNLSTERKRVLKELLRFVCLVPTKADISETFKGAGFPEATPYPDKAEVRH